MSAKTNTSIKSGECNTIQCHPKGFRFRERKVVFKLCFVLYKDACMVLSKTFGIIHDIYNRRKSSVWLSLGLLLLKKRAAFWQCYLYGCFQKTQSEYVFHDVLSTIYILMMNCHIQKTKTVIEIKDVFQKRMFNHICNKIKIKIYTLKYTKSITYTLIK